MLQSLHVKNIALIDDAEIEFGKGMHVLSGETGAGKSIIIDAVNFTLGKRMPRDVVREDAEYALCELVFSVDTPQQEQVLSDLDLPNEDGTVIMQRKITNGRSICKVNGESVSTGALKELANVLIDIHGQHEHQSLLYKKKHQEILDDYCGKLIEDDLAALSAAHAKYTALSKEYEEAKVTGGNKDKEIDFAKFEVDEIENARLREGEDEELEADYRRMSNAKRLSEAVGNAHQYTGYDSSAGAGAGLGRAISELRSVSEYDEELSELLSQLTEVDNLLNDFNRSIADYEKGLYFEEKDFLETEERLNLLNHLKNKYGRTIAEVLAYKEERERLIEKLTDYEAYLIKLEDKVKSQRRVCLDLCARISAVRQKEALKLSKELQEGLVDLNFLDARFEIVVDGDEDRMSAKGYDDVEFMISTNPGEKVKPLINVASGGELSRIMLALKAVLSKRDHVSTLIFDEIDTGISGRTAQKVSEKLAYLAMEHQVICVTHLPQIAAMADIHYEIKKHVEGGRTVTEVQKLSDENIVTELARMLSGTEVTKTVLDNAREMKRLADEKKGQMK